MQENANLRMSAHVFPVAVEDMGDHFQVGI